VETLNTAFDNDVDVATAYYYCEYIQRETHSVERVLRSILSQLLSHCPKIPLEVQHAFQLHIKGATELSTRECEELLRVVFKCFRRCFIIIDALDEFFLDKQKVKVNGIELVKDLNAELKLFDIDNCHVLLTSRHDCLMTTTLSKKLRPVIIEIEAKEEDLVSFFHAGLLEKEEELDDSEAESSSLVERMTKTLVAKVRGQ
jgi:hypothetical protein